MKLLKHKHVHRLRLLKFSNNKITVFWRNSELKMSEDEWYEPVGFEIEVIQVKSDCRVNHKVGETFNAEYRTPDNPICGEAFIGMYPLLYAVRVNGDMRQLGKENKFETTYFCPSRVVKFFIRGIPRCNNCGKDVNDFSELTLVEIKYPKNVCKECYNRIKSLSD